MASDDDVPGDSEHVPLPPERPIPEPDLPEGDADTGAPRLDLGKPADLPPTPEHVDVPLADPASSGAADDVDGANGPAAPSDWWRGEDVRNEWRDDWREQSGEATVAAHELGFQLQQAAGTISDAVASQAYPAAAKRGLDIRWMRLSLNLPAIALALLVTYGGRTATDRMVRVVAEDGPFAPLGWLLLAVLVLGVFMVLPIGTPLAHALGHLVQAVGSGLVTAARRGWRTRGVGYVMRLAVAVAVWSFVFAVLRLAGGGIIHWLTGA